MEDREDYTDRITTLMKRHLRRKPTVVTADSDGGDPELAAKGATLRAAFTSAGIPAYPSLQRAARALVHLHAYYTKKPGT
jgi:hypothetical protein